MLQRVFILVTPFSLFVSLVYIFLRRLARYTFFNFLFSSHSSPLFSFLSPFLRHVCFQIPWPYAPRTYFSIRQDRASNAVTQDMYRPNAIIDLIIRNSLRPSVGGFSNWRIKVTLRGTRAWIRVSRHNYSRTDVHPTISSFNRDGDIVVINRGAQVYFRSRWKKRCSRVLTFWSIATFLFTSCRPAISISDVCIL